MLPGIVPSTGRRVINLSEQGRLHHHLTFHEFRWLRVFFFFTSSKKVQMAVLFIRAIIFYRPAKTILLLSLTWARLVFRENNE